MRLCAASFAALLLHGKLVERMAASCRISKPSERPFRSDHLTEIAGSNSNLFLASGFAADAEGCRTSLTPIARAGVLEERDSYISSATAKTAAASENRGFRPVRITIRPKSCSRAPLPEARSFSPVPFAIANCAGDSDFLLVAAEGGSLSTYIVPLRCTRREAL